MNFFWHVILSVAFNCARVVIKVTKIRINGSMAAIWHNGKILLIRNSYRKGWSIPGGLRKKGETWAAAAVRETFEEIGVTLNQSDLIFVAEVSGDLGLRNRTQLFEVEVDGPVDLKIDGREIVDAEFVTPREALKRSLDKNVWNYLMAHPRLSK